MKIKIKTLRKVLLLTIFPFLSLTMAAQTNDVYAYSSNKSKKSDSESLNSRFYVGYFTMPMTIGGGWTRGLDNGTGVAIGVNHEKCLSNDNIPIFLEAGVEFEYASFNSKDITYRDDELSLNMYSISVPVNLAFHFEMPSTSLTFSPFIGVNLKYNISGGGKYRFWYDYDYKYDSPYEEDVNLFEEASGYNTVFDHPASKRVQFGINLGIGVIIDRFNISYKHTFDTTKLWNERMSELKTSMNVISLGYYF